MVLPQTETINNMLLSKEFVWIITNAFHTENNIIFIFRYLRVQYADSVFRWSPGIFRC